MKESKLKEMVEKLSIKLKERGIVKNCYDLVVKMGEGETIVHSWHTNLNYTFKEKDLEIHLNDGLTEMGGGIIEVNYRGKKVLYGDKGTLEASMKRDLLVQVEQFAILEYHKGPWENKVKQILYSPLKKPQQEAPKDLEVSEEKVESFREKYKPLSVRRKTSPPECAEDRMEKMFCSREDHGLP